MSESSDKGKTLELRVAKLIRSKLKAGVIRDPRSGAGEFHKTDIKDWYGEFPFSVEIKNQKTLKIGEWWRQADAGAGYRQPPALVFAMDNEVLATVRLNDLVDLVAELAQQQVELQRLQTPMPALPPPEVLAAQGRVFTCRNGHLVSPGSNQCLDKHCPYSSSRARTKKSKEGK